MSSDSLFSAADHAAQALRHAKQVVKYLKLAEKALGIPLLLPTGCDVSTHEIVQQTIDAMRQIVGNALAFEQHDVDALQDLLTRLPRFAQLIRLLEQGEQSKPSDGTVKDE